MSTNTLSYVSDWWPTFDMDRQAFDTIDIHGVKRVDTSRGGDGMVLLSGLVVRINGNWIRAHLSFPPDATQLGTFTEGHLKIEEGPLLNQYFFSCEADAVDDTWEVERLGNSPTVPTQNPGNWANIPDDLWHDLEVLVTHLAYRPRP